MDEATKAALRARGLWNEDGISRRARARTCPRCGAVTMAGLDGDRCSAPAVCNPQPLNAHGELAALLAGQRTFTLTWMGGRYELDYRDAGRIKFNPPGSEPNQDILAEHKCGQEFNQQLTTASNAIRNTKGAEYPDEPNF